MADVAVWLIRIDDMADALDRREITGGKLLCACDLQHIQRQPDEQRRRSARATRAALRLALREHLGGYSASQPIAHDRNGKPLLPAGTGAFSISHTERTALIAVSREGSVGIDIEATRELSFSAERQQKIRAAASRLGVDVLSDDVFGLLQGWTRLEAVAKARGSGIGRLLAELGIWGGGAGEKDAAMVAEESAKLVGREGYSVHDLRLPPELFGSLAACPALGAVDIEVRRVSAAQLL